MITVANISELPICDGTSFIVRAIARNQSDQCKGCAWRFKGFRCQYECGNTNLPCDLKCNIKKVKDGDMVQDRQGNPYRVCQISDFQMEFKPYFRLPKGI